MTTENIVVIVFIHKTLLVKETEAVLYLATRLSIQGAAT